MESAPSCARVVVVLSRDFLKHEWSHYQVRKASFRYSIFLASYQRLSTPHTLSRNFYSVRFLAPDSNFAPLQVRSALHTVLRQKSPRDCLFILYDAPEAMALDPDLRAYLKKCRKLDYRRDSMFWARLR